MALVKRNQGKVGKKIGVLFLGFCSIQFSSAVALADDPYVGSGADFLCNWDSSHTTAATCDPSDPATVSATATDPTTGAKLTGQAACFAIAGQSATDGSTQLSQCASTNTTVGTISIGAGVGMAATCFTVFLAPECLTGLGLIAVGTTCLIDAAAEQGSASTLTKVAQQDSAGQAALNAGSKNSPADDPTKLSNSKITIDPSFIPNPAAFKSATGMSVDDFAKAVNAGQIPWMPSCILRISLPTPTK